MQFQESYKRIYMSDGVAIFECPLSKFIEYEPEYIPLALPYVTRYWDNKRQYVSDGDTVSADIFYTRDRLEYFVGKRAAYQSMYDADNEDNQSVIPPISPDIPSIYAVISLSGGDGKSPILGIKLGDSVIGTMNITGDIRAMPTTPGLPVNITFAWRITLRKIISEFSTIPIDSFPVDGCTITNNQINMIFDPAILGLSPGIYMISDEDFATVPGAVFGLPSDYKVKLVGGAKYFKVLK